MDPLQELAAKLGTTNVTNAITPIRRFDYKVDFASISNGDTATGSLKIDSGTAFIVDRIFWSGTDPANILLELSAQDQKFSNGPVRADAYCGDGNNQFYDIQPMLLPPNSQLSISVTNKSGGTLTDNQLVLIGRKVPPRLA